MPLSAKQQSFLRIAPMMECTDRHYRYLLRLISPHSFLYTEMVTSGALLAGARKDLLAYDPLEHPLALQIGGSDPKAMAQCAKLAEQYGYDEVNINVGCPSNRVQSGQFGACLMRKPHLVAKVVAAMARVTKIPVTVKTRIGVDNEDSYQHLYDFINIVSQAGCQCFIIHARKAWLSGLNPKQNRQIPPLCYARVYQIKQDFPALTIIINGGIQTIAQIEDHLQHVDGVMLGRAAYQNPYAMLAIERHFYPSNKPSPTRRQIFENYLPYVERQLAKGVKLNRITKHLQGLFQSIPGAKAWRRYLSEHANQAGADIDVLLKATLALEA